MGWDSGGRGTTDDGRPTTEVGGSGRGGERGRPGGRSGDDGRPTTDDRRLPAARLAPWSSAWVAAGVGFPHLPHDDRADAAAMALLRRRGHVEPYRVVLRPRREGYGDEVGWGRARVLGRGRYA